MIRFTLCTLFTVFTRPWLFICLFIFFCNNVSAQVRFSINGHVDNMASNEYSKNYINDSDLIVLNFLNLARKDTVAVINNTFHLEGELPYPSIAMLEYKSGGNLILLDNSTYQFDLTLLKVDSIYWQYEGAITSTSPFYNLWKDFYDHKTMLLKESNDLNLAAQHCTNTDSTLYYAFAVKAADKKIAAAFHQLAIDHPNSYITAYILPAAPDFSYENYIDVYNSFSDHLKNTFYGKNFYSRMMASKDVVSIQPKTEAGTFPVTNAMDTALNKITLDKVFFGKHQYTLIEFWASWCGPCRKVNEDLKKKLALFKNKDVALVGFSLDMASEAWKIAVINDRLPWLQISDLKAINSPLAVYLELTVIPANVLVDRSGRIVRMNIYDGELDEFLKGGN